VVVSGEPVVGEVVPVSPVEPAGSVSDGASTDEPAVVADGALEAALGSVVVTEIGTAGSAASGASADEPSLHAARTEATRIASAAAGARRICMRPT
jgi:hypothetical protein